MLWTSALLPRADSPPADPDARDRADLDAYRTRRIRLATALALWASWSPATWRHPAVRLRRAGRTGPGARVRHRVPRR